MKDKVMMLSFFKQHRITLLLNSITILFLFVLPFYLFQGKLYVGGDDTRLFYVYPQGFLKAMAFFTWSNISSLGVNNPSFHFVPFLFLWSFFANSIHSKAVLDYLGFSFPFILGFIYFQKLLRSLSSEIDPLECYLGSLFLIVSPIIIVNQTSVFLTSVWLIGVLPAIFYYFIKYLRTNNFIYVLVTIFFCVIFSLALDALPWILGVLIPIFLALVLVAFFYKKKEILYFIKKFIVFFGFLILSQTFWIIPFLGSFIHIDTSNVSGRVFLPEVLSTFTQTVIQTATGDVLYPLLNLFFRQIAIDYNWQLKNVFLNYYDHIFFINSIFFIIVIVGFIFHKKFKEKESNVWLFIVFGFILSLFFFTVNIGPLKYLFLFFGHVPGFVIFRNFYDKFALGYIFFYAILLTFSLSVLKRTIVRKYYYLLAAGVYIIIVLNAVPIKSIVNSPLWQTRSAYRTTNFTPEYLDFLNKVKTNVDPTTNILGVPFNIAAYAIVANGDGQSAYIGTSPVKILTGINDLTGELSFPSQISSQFVSDISNRKYKDLNTLLDKYNIGYVMVTKNVPTQIKNSYLFKQDVLQKQDTIFLRAIEGKLIVSSHYGNYQLYSTKKQSLLLTSKNLTFKKLNDVQYELSIKNVKYSQELVFKEPFHSGWKLLLQKDPTDAWCGNIIKTFQQTSECQQGNIWFSPSELYGLFTKPTFDKSHTLYDDYANVWTIDPNYIKNNVDKKYYTVNSDGSISLELKLYFIPQLYFYVGILISLLTFVVGLVYFIYRRRKYDKS